MSIEKTDNLEGVSGGTINSKNVMYYDVKHNNDHVARFSMDNRESAKMFDSSFYNLPENEQNFFKDAYSDPESLGKNQSILNAKTQEEMNAAVKELLGTRL